MPANIRRRKSIHDRETPQRENSQDEVNLEQYENSISSSESDEKYEDVIKVTKNTCVVLSAEVSRPRLQNKPTPSIINNKPCIFAFLCLVLLGIVAYSYHEEKQQFCSFENLRNQYPNEVDSVWKHLQLGIEMILNRKIEKPAVYLLAHREKDSSVSLVEKIAQQASKCFGKRLVPIESDDFVQGAGSLDDYGHTIEKYKSKIKEGNVFLIANLNEIPAHAARALHAICDTHSPIRKNVVIFLALTIEENKTGNSHSVAEETLRELWGSKLGRHELDPLITRVTDQVIILKS